MDFILKKRLLKCCAPLLMAALLLNACAMNEKEQTVAPVNTLEKFTPEFIEKTDYGYKLTIKGTLLSNHILSEFIL